jgi:hypothetical protein
MRDVFPEQREATVKETQVLQYREAAEKEVYPSCAVTLM